MHSTIGRYRMGLILLAVMTVAKAMSTSMQGAVPVICLVRICC